MTVALQGWFGLKDFIGAGAPGAFLKDGAGVDDYPIAKHAGEHMGFCIRSNTVAVV
jgi:hypothetical protein